MVKYYRQSNIFKAFSGQSRERPVYKPGSYPFRKLPQFSGRNAEFSRSIALTRMLKNSSKKISSFLRRAGKMKYLRNRIKIRKVLRSKLPQGPADLIMSYLS